jgi:hypothetical protein
MAQATYGPEEAVRRARDLYERNIRARVEPGNKGKYLMLDIETGEYEIGDDYSTLSDRMLARKPEAALVAMRIGYPSLGRVGGRKAAAPS